MSPPTGPVIMGGTQPLLLLRRELTYGDGVSWVTTVTLRILWNTTNTLNTIHISLKEHALMKQKDFGKHAFALKPWQSSQQSSGLLLNYLSYPLAVNSFIDIYLPVELSLKIEGGRARRTD